MYIYWGPKKNKKSEEIQIYSLFFGQNIHLLLPLDIGSPGSQDFGFGLEVLAFLSLQSFK